MWKHHVVYESIPRSVIINLGKKLYRIPKTLSAATVSLIMMQEHRLMKMKLSMTSPKLVEP